MDDLIFRAGTDAAIFDPQRVKRVIAKADAVARFAAEMRNWPLLEKAIDEKLDWQQGFVDWWRVNVTPRSRKGSRVIPDGITQAAASNATGISQVQVSRWATWLKRRDETRVALINAAMKRQFAESARGVVETLNTGDMEGYTPAKYIEAARRAMGGIDLDPATHETAQLVVQAVRYYTKADDGLAQHWSGRVFLNPPYNSGLIEKFIAKLLSEIVAGRVSQAILLTNNNTDTRWFHSAAEKSQAFCLTKGRINFYKPDSSIVAPTNGQVFFYFGDRALAFATTFATFGFIASQWQQ